MQLSLFELSLYYATTVLGGLHRWYTLNEPAASLNPDAFIFRQYNKAIHHLVRPTKPLSKVVTLVACYVFSSIEAPYGDYISSFTHVSSGIKLLPNENNETMPQIYPMVAPATISSSEEEQIEEKLLHHFSHLDLQAATFNPEWDPQLMNDSLMRRPTISFSTLEEARVFSLPLCFK